MKFAVSMFRVHPIYIKMKFAVFVFSTPYLQKDEILCFRV